MFLLALLHTLPAGVCVMQVYNNMLQVLSDEDRQLPALQSITLKLHLLLSLSETQTVHSCCHLLSCAGVHQHAAGAE
jgi:hypothetical protein